MKQAKAWRWSALALLLAAAIVAAQEVMETYRVARTPERGVMRAARAGLTSADALDYAATTGVAACAADPSIVVVPTWSTASATAQIHVALYDRHPATGVYTWSGIATIQTMTAVATNLGTGSVLSTDGTTLLTARYPAAGPPMLVDTYGRAGYRVLVGAISAGNLAYQAHSLGAASQGATQ